MSTKTINPYRAIFILDSRGSEAPAETLSDNLKEAIASVGCEAGEVESLGRKDFVRVTDKQHTGDTYLRIGFKGPGGSPAALREKLRLDSAVKQLFVERL